MTHLRRLKLASVPFGDDDIKFLTRFKELQNLNLWATNITDRGLKDLAESTSIEVLFLGKIAISDKGIQHVSKMKSLKVLNFSDVPITDAAIDSLCQLTQLKAIRLIRTKITEDGASRLRAALPSCRVVHAHPKKLRIDCQKILFFYYSFDSGTRVYCNLVLFLRQDIHLFLHATTDRRTTTTD